MTDRSPRPEGRASRRPVILVMAGAAVVVGIGVAVALGGFPATTPTPAPGATEVPSPVFTDLVLVTVPPAEPSATAPTASAPASSPAGTAAPSPAPTSAPAEGIVARRIRIPRLDIDLAIIEGDGIDAPIGKAAHYPGSAWPGGGSNTYIYGHAREGMLITLWRARTGDRIELDLADGTTRTYVVTKVLPEVPWDAVEYLEPTPTEQLTLQTSTSYYPTAPRFVVIAVPEP